MSVSAVGEGAQFPLPSAAGNDAKSIDRLLMSQCGFLQRFLLVAALLAGELDAGGTLFRLDAVWRTAFAASCLDPRVALFDDEGLLFHGLADQALGLLAHRLLRHTPHLS